MPTNSKRSKNVKENLKDMTLISQNAAIEGEVRFSGSLRLEGRVKGNIVSESEQGQLTIGETGVVEGEISVPSLIVNGTVNGNIHSSKHVELAAKAKVNGNVHYALIEIVMGASVNGSLLHKDAQKPDGKVEKSEAKGKGGA